MSTVLTTCVKELIKETALRKPDIIRGSGVSHSTIHAILRGDADNCRSETIERLVCFILENDEALAKTIDSKTFPLNARYLLSCYNQNKQTLFKSSGAELN